MHFPADEHALYCTWTVQMRFDTGAGLTSLTEFSWFFSHRKCWFTSKRVYIQKLTDKVTWNDFFFLIRNILLCGRHLNPRLRRSHSSVYMHFLKAFHDPTHHWIKTSKPTDSAQTVLCCEWAPNPKPQPRPGHLCKFPLATLPFLPFTCWKRCRCGHHHVYSSSSRDIWVHNTRKRTTQPW